MTPGTNEPATKKRQSAGIAYAAGNGDGETNTRIAKIEEQNNRGKSGWKCQGSGKVYAVGNAGANPDNNVVTALELFYTQLHEILIINVKLADGRIVG
ncbi:hypothetical protein Tco_0725213 [Tanacetum coccineum]